MSEFGISGADAVKVECRDYIMLITIDRPATRNAVNLDVAVGVGDALERAEADPSVRAVIITGSGNQSFCSGADLKAVARGERMQPDDPRQREWGFAGYVRHHISKPTIAAVNGVALGGGTELVLASDLAIAVEGALFGLPEVKRGILPAAGGAIRLIDQIPRKLALEMLFTGEPINARRALELGLINHVVADGALLDAAMAMAHRITTNAPLAVQACKRIALRITDGEIPGEADAWRRSREEALLVRNSKDAREGSLAFREKRAPTWTGQ